MPLTQFGWVLLAFRAYDQIVETPTGAFEIMWKPDAADFRRSAHFDAVVRAIGLLDYWQARGFPPHCRPVGDDGFECD